MQNIFPLRMKSKTAVPTRPLLIRTQIKRWVAAIQTEVSKITLEKDNSGIFLKFKINSEKFLVESVKQDYFSSPPQILYSGRLGMSIRWSQSNWSRKTTLEKDNQKIFEEQVKFSGESKPGTLKLALPTRHKMYKEVS